MEAGLLYSLRGFAPNLVFGAIMNIKIEGEYKNDSL